MLHTLKLTKQNELSHLKKTRQNVKKVLHYASENRVMEKERVPLHVTTTVISIDVITLYGEIKRKSPVLVRRGRGMRLD